mmetsp:Transcript_60871/g.108167  ORF Transcript_60871/g.108167 Transcript_60871/m.108167 type:complete len:351 (+) Transcript_60871:90-1142(+)
MSAKGCCALRFSDVIPDNPLGICCCGCCTLVNLILIILFFPCTVTQLGQFKYGLTKNTITGIVELDQTFLPGRYWIGFWKTFIEFPSTLNTIEFSNERPEANVQHLSVLVSRDKDGKLIELDVSIQYRLMPDRLGKIYEQMTTLYEDVYISDLRDQLSKAATEFQVNATWTRYRSIRDLMLSKCVTILEKRHAECWDLQLWGVKVDSGYEGKLIQTQVKKQRQTTAEWILKHQVFRADTQKQLATITKDKQIVVADGNAQKYNLEKEAIAKAEAQIVSANAKIISIIRDKVKFNGTHMTDEQIVRYQQLVMLQAQADSSVVYELSHGGGGLANHNAARNLLAHKRLTSEL